MAGNFSAWSTSVGGTSVLSATALTCTLSAYSSTVQAHEELFGKPVHQITLSEVLCWKMLPATIRLFK